jgi:hypothetical protein
VDLRARSSSLRDQYSPMEGTPFTFPAFKFESRRVRVDWRLLNGVDVQRVVRPATAAGPAGAYTCPGALPVSG